MQAVHRASALLVASTSVACAPAAAPAPANVAQPSLAGRALIEITEPDATVATTVTPVVLSAGPSALFVAQAVARCPEDMALVADRVCVDKWEASVVRVVGGKEKVWSPFETLDEVDGSYRAVSRPGIVPQGYISGHQAERACRGAGKRLCTATEWERGCRGPSKS